MSEQRFCPYCGTAAVPGGAFCVRCGRPVGAAGPPAVPGTSATDEAPAIPVPVPAGVALSAATPGPAAFAAATLAPVWADAATPGPQVAGSSLTGATASSPPAPASLAAASTTATAAASTAGRPAVTPSTASPSAAWTTPQPPVAQAAPAGWGQLGLAPTAVAAPAAWAPAPPQSGQAAPATWAQRQQAPSGQAAWAPPQPPSGQAAWAPPQPPAGPPGAAGQGPRIVPAPPPVGVFGGPPAGAPPSRPFGPTSSGNSFWGSQAGAAGARPTGIMILAVLAGIGALIGLWTGFQYLQAADVYGYYGYNGDAVKGIGFVILAVSLAWIAVVWGLWMLRPWAWYAAGAVAGLSLGLQVLALLNGSQDVAGSLLQVVANALIIYYLSTPAVRAVYRRPGGGPGGA